MGYLDTSSLEEATKDLVPPTMEEFMARVGDPTLSFDIATPQIDIPKGILNCCRVTHQPHCAHHVAGTILGCFYTLRYPDGEVRERVPEHQSFDGDILATYERLGAAVQVTYLLVKATAENLGATVLGLHFDAWALNAEDWEAWRYLRKVMEDERRAALSDMDEMPADQIRRLEVAALPKHLCTPKALATLMARAGFHPAVGYADRVEILPHEIGHDEEYRYVTDIVWGEEGVVPPAVDALNAIPDEAEEAEEQPCRDRTPAS